MNYRLQQKITRICWVVGLSALAIPFVFPLKRKVFRWK